MQQYPARKGRNFAGWVLFAAFLVPMPIILGCVKLTPEQQLIREVNADDKEFEGTWLYKVRNPGQPEPVLDSTIEVKVSKGRFRLTVTGAAAPGKRELIYNGKLLSLLDYSSSRVTEGDRDLVRLPFWKMPSAVTPLGKPTKAGEETVAGRVCTVVRMKGKFEQGDATLTYWIDKETKVLLKKENILSTEGLPLAGEVFGAESVSFSPAVTDRDFERGKGVRWKPAPGPAPGLDLINNTF